MEKEVLRFVKLTPSAFGPSKGNEDSAGFDLYRYHILPIAER